MRKWIVLLMLIAVSSIIWLPAVAAFSHPDKYQYYIKALEYLLKGLQEYFKAVITLFREAVR